MGIIRTPMISVVSPVYLAEECVVELCQRLISELSRLTNDFEIILVDDRSPDKSWSVIQKQSKLDRRVKGIRLARNFGQHQAITAGLDAAQGDWIVVMDCDLQDPPEGISALYQEALRGYEIVVARFELRRESGFRQFISKTFWRMLSWLAGLEFDPRVGNFRIMSRLVVDNMGQYREQLRYLGGIVALMGFTSSHVAMARHSRFKGESSYTFSRLASIATDIALAYSDKPLKISIFIGLFITLGSFLVGGIALALQIAGIVQMPGWTSVIVSLYAIGGLILANLGVIGYYLGRTFDEVKRRPLYIVESTTTKTVIPQAS